MPPETHFLALFAPELLRRRRFPLDASSLVAELEAFAALPTSRGLPIDVPAIVEGLNGRCQNLLDLFAAIVLQLAGKGRVYGEKTPEHLLWWRQLTRASPALKIIATIRDPRAVVASNLKVPWGLRPHTLVAERWAHDQREAAAAWAELPGDRFLLVRYEDVVVDPWATRSRLAAFLGVQDQAEIEREQGPTTLYLPWEGDWKGRASEPITTDRIDLWRSQLTPGQIADVVAICRREMRLFGYGNLLPSPGFAVRRLALLPPGSQWRRFHFKTARRRSIRMINGRETLRRAGF